MVQDFIEKYAKLIAEYKDDITITRNDIDDSFSEIVINAKKEDAGRLIGKDGKMISSIKSIIGGCKAKEDRAYRVIVKVIGE